MSARRSPITWRPIGRPGLERWGEYVLISPAEIDRADAFFARYGAATVFFGRLLPVVRTFIAFPAGLARMPMLKFQVYTFLGSWPWCFALAYIGYVLGARWNSDPTFRKLFHDFDASLPPCWWPALPGSSGRAGARVRRS